MNRGEFYWVSLDPTVGGEINKTRPGIILSNNVANRVLNRVVMIPLTTNVEKELPGEAIVELNGKRQKAMGSQLRTVSKLRIGKRLVRYRHSIWTRSNSPYRSSWASIQQNFTLSAGKPTAP